MYHVATCHAHRACHVRTESREEPASGKETDDPTSFLSDSTYSLISFRKSISPRKRQLNISISNSEQYVDDFAGKLPI